MLYKLFYLAGGLCNVWCLPFYGVIFFLFRSFYDNPKLAEDMIQTHTVPAHTLISVSVGKCPWDHNYTRIHNDIT